MRFFYTSSLVLLIFVSGTFAFAQSTDDEAAQIRTKINGNRGELQKIEQDIEKYKKELGLVQGKKRTLQSSIQELDISRRKTVSSINLTQSRIKNTKSKIDSLSDTITTKALSIKNGYLSIAQSLRRMHEEDEKSVIELLLRSDHVATAWTSVDALRQFQSVIQTWVGDLESDKKILETSMSSKESEERNLIAEKTELNSEKNSLDINRRSKNNLLKITKNTESEYQSLLATKIAAKKEFEAQLASFEAQLKYVLDRSKISAAGEGSLLWPLSNVFLTQYFGNTKFASSGAYNGSGHNGIDFRAAIGTRVSAASGGVVLETGNTDAVRGCYSYGKWIVVKHTNGLATLYAHLSKRSVVAGESVVAGQQIGYSGNTGYSTGPHLHFSVFAADAVKIVRMGDIKTRTNCADARVPIAPTQGYLNPLNYL